MYVAQVERHSAEGSCTITHCCRDTREILFGRFLQNTHSRRTDVEIATMTSYVVQCTTNGSGNPKKIACVGFYNK